MSRTAQSWILGSHNTRTITSSTSSKGGLCKLRFLKTVLIESQVFVDVVADTSTSIMVKSATYVYRCVLTWTKMLRFWYSFIRVLQTFLQSSLQFCVAFLQSFAYRVFKDEFFSYWSWSSRTWTLKTSFIITYLPLLQKALHIIYT